MFIDNQNQQSQWEHDSTWLTWTNMLQESEVNGSFCLIHFWTFGWTAEQSGALFGYFKPGIHAVKGLSKRVLDAVGVNGTTPLLSPWRAPLPVSTPRTITAALGETGSAAQGGLRHNNTIITFIFDIKKACFYTSNPFTILQRLKGWNHHWHSSLYEETVRLKSSHYWNSLSFISIVYAHVWIENMEGKLKR